MNSKHELEWAYQQDYDLGAPIRLNRREDMNFLYFRSLLPQGYWEIQRIEVQMTDGYIESFQSKYSNTINFNNRFVICSAARKLKRPGCCPYYKAAFMMEKVAEVRIWVDNPPNPHNGNNGKDSPEF